MLFVFFEYPFFSERFSRNYRLIHSLTLFNFQGSVRSFPLVRELFYSITSNSVCQVLFSSFSKFLLIQCFFRTFLTTASLRQLCNCITSSSLCQALFSIFFKIFLCLLLLPHDFRNCARFPLLGGCQSLFRASLSATASLSYHTTPPLSSFIFAFFHDCGICPNSSTFPQHSSRILSSGFPLSLRAVFPWCMPILLCVIHAFI